MNNKVFFIADTHFGDDNIIKYENRPFQSIDEMDNAIISNWNSVVTFKDKVFLLGDFSNYNKEKSYNICNQLNGYKTLILGNHDTQNIKYYLDCGFDEIIKYPIIYDNFWILSHEPMYINQNMPYANIFGHIHQNPMYKTASKQSFCVSLERIDYTPIEFMDIKKRMLLI